MAEDEYRDIKILCFLFDLFDKVISVFQGFVCSARNTPVLLLDCAPSESTLVPRKSLDSTFCKVVENMVVTFNIFTESMEEQEQSDRCCRRLLVTKIKSSTVQSMFW